MQPASECRLESAQGKILGHDIFKDHAALLDDSKSLVEISKFAITQRVGDV